MLESLLNVFFFPNPNAELIKFSFCWILMSPFPFQFLVQTFVFSHFANYNTTWLASFLSSLTSNHGAVQPQFWLQDQALHEGAQRHKGEQGHGPTELTPFVGKTANSLHCSQGAL